MQFDGATDKILELPEPLRSLVQEITFARPYVEEFSAFINDEILAQCGESLGVIVFDRLKTFDRAGFKLEDYIAVNLSDARILLCAALIDAYRGLSDAYPD